MIEKSLLRHRVVRFLHLTGIVMAFTGILLFAYSRMLLRSAQSFVDDLRSLRVGKSSQVEIQRLKSAHPDVWKKKVCKTSQDCEFDFAVENTWLHRFHLVPWTKLQGTIYIAEGTLSRMGITFESQRGEFGFGALVVESQEPNGGQKSYDVRHRRYQDELPEDVIIHLSPAASAVERRLAYSFDLTCLIRFNGCKDSSELLPAAWSKK